MNCIFGQTHLLIIYQHTDYYLNYHDSVLCFGLFNARPLRAENYASLYSSIRNIDIIIIVYSFDGLNYMKIRNPNNSVLHSLTAIPLESKN